MKVSKQQIILKNKQELDALSNQLYKLEMEAEETKVVIETLGGYDVNRKCYRLVGGVLTEHKVGDTIPSLEEQKKLMTGKIDQLREVVEEKYKELKKFSETKI